MAVQNMQFLDSDGNVLDELYFGYKNQYNGANTRNRVDLKGTTVVKIHYQKLIIKKVAIDKNFGLGF